VLEVDEGVTPQELHRIRRTLSAIPADAASCLEIGFLDLRVTRMLRQHLDVVSIDLPRCVDDGGAYKLAFADVRWLPFRDRAFDLVLCTEVLEHLPRDVLVQATVQLERVASKYVLVTVPFRQRVWNALFRCRFCAYQCNTMGHLHWFDLATVDSLFPRMQRQRHEMIGEVPGNAPDWLYALGRSVGRVWHPDVFDTPGGTCPRCKRRGAAIAPTRAGWLIQRIIWRIERFARPQPAWLLARYAVSASNPSS
jgi:Methyltransferase domain